jgi:hypothetical protein
MKDGDNAAERKRDAAAFAVMAATDSMMLFNRREQVRRRHGHPDDGHPDLIAFKAGMPTMIVDPPTLIRDHVRNDPEARNHRKWISLPLSIGRAVGDTMSRARPIPMAPTPPARLSPSIAGGDTTRC